MHTAAASCLLLVGGSGQYITAVEEGWSIPRVPAGISNCAPSWKTFVAAAIRARLCTINCDKLIQSSAERIHPNNTRRVIRALEVQRP